MCVCSTSFLRRTSSHVLKQMVAASWKMYHLSCNLIRCCNGAVGTRSEVRKGQRVERKGVGWRECEGNHSQLNLKWIFPLVQCIHGQSNKCALLSSSFRWSILCKFTRTWSSLRSSSGVSGSWPRVSGGLIFTSLPRERTTSSRLYRSANTQEAGISPCTV